MNLWPNCMRILVGKFSPQKSRFLIQRLTSQGQRRMTMSSMDMESLLAAIEAVKEEKKAVKGQPEVEKGLAEKLKELNLQRANLLKASASGTEDGSTLKKFNLKVPKGTKDYSYKEMAIREQMFSTIVSVFKTHGAVTIDTPVFELKEILSGKYGEDSKLIYDLEDQGGEKCSLRYDLTVPFARFLAMNRDIQNFKRYHIAKVYRRDQPSVNKGRMREFFQCDFDIAGIYDSMMPDAEILVVMSTILDKLDVGSYTIKLNHRQILDGMFKVCGVPENKIRSISSAVDKLDKMSWEDVKKEMVNDKGLDPKVADRIGEYVKLSGSQELCDVLLADPALSSNATAKKGIKDMETLFAYLSVFNIKHKVSFDLSLARGLDYYTGIIYEAVLSNASQSEETSGIGSIAAGGRYDELVGMFSGGRKIPCVGVSIGVERVFSIFLRKAKTEEVRATATQVYVIGIGELVLERMQILRELWDAGISAEMMFKTKPKLASQWNACDKDNVPLAVIIGGSEVEQGVVKIKDLTNKSGSQDEKEKVIPRTAMVEEIRKKLATMTC